MNTALKNLALAFLFFLVVIAAYLVSRVLLRACGLEVVSLASVALVCSILWRRL